MAAPTLIKVAPQYDIALSFARQQRAIAEELARGIAAAGYRVFYDDWEKADLWGADLYQYLSVIYRDAARFCIVIASANYNERIWTHHELKNAQARAIHESASYILPLRVDDSPVLGILDTIGYIDLRATTIEEVVKLVAEKLKLPTRGIRRDFEKLDASRKLTLILRAAADRNRDYVPELCSILRSSGSADLRSRAAWALDQIGEATSKQALLDALADQDWEVRSNAGWALVHLGAQVVDSVTNVAQSSASAAAREMAELVLERIGSIGGLGHV